MAAVSIATLTGESGILTQANSAKEKVEFAEEKEAISVAYSGCLAENKERNVSSKALESELINNGYSASVSGGKTLKVTFTDSGNIYMITQNGNISKYEQTPTTAVYAKLYTDGTLILSSYDYTDESKTLEENGDFGEIKDKEMYDGFSESNSYYSSADFSGKVNKILIYDKIAPISTDYYFENLSNLTEIQNINNFNTSNVTSMRGMFSCCSSLNRIDVKNFDTSTVTDMTSMFLGCSGLSNVDVSNFDTNKVASMNGMFGDCSNLDNIDLSYFNTSVLTDMGAMFAGCTSLTSINFGDWNTSNVQDMTWMFTACTDLTTIDLSCFEVNNLKWCDHMFWSCTKLETIIVDKDKWNATNMVNVDEGYQMFLDCTSLVGDKGTTYNASYVDRTYAHIDEGAENPGYLTSKK